MTKPPDLHGPEALWWAANGLCVCCAGPVDLAEMTVDHVVPRRPAANTLRRMRAVRGLISKAGMRCSVKAPAHARCNSRKSNRPPTGCELVFLMAVNSRLYKGGA